MSWLILLAATVSLYDLCTRRVPNWVTLPLLAAGLLVRFPGSLDLWLMSLALVSAWVSGWMGAGDVKLWLALAWSMPVQVCLPLLFLSFALTGLAQILWCKCRGQPATGQPTPGAWRTLPFLLLSWYAH
jgi:Flp pilus assembly protein protease CpaA